MFFGLFCRFILIFSASMAAAHALADAAAKVLSDDKEMRRGIYATLSSIKDIDEQLVAIDSLSEKGLGLRTEPKRSAVNTPALGTPTTPMLPQVGQTPPATGLARTATPVERFVMWSPMVDTHIYVQDAEELQEVDRNDLILEVPKPLKTSSSLPELGRRESLNSSKAERKKMHPAAAELRRSALNMGLPPQLTTTYVSQCTVPVQKAVDPKWSTDLKRADWRNAQRIQYENLSARVRNMSPFLSFPFSFGVVFPTKDF